MRNESAQGRAPRVDTRFAATVIDSDGASVAVIVTDISREGCRLKTDGSLHAGERIRIDIARYGSYPAEVRWARGDEVGAVFLEPVILP